MTLTWEELEGLPDRSPVYIDQGNQPYACVLRWEGETACFYVIDPATMDDTLVICRCGREKFNRRKMKVWER